MDLQGIHFLQIRIPADFLMWIRIQLNKICNKSLYAEYSGVEEDQQDCSKAKNHGADANLLTIQTNFLASFCFFSNFFSLKSFSSGSGCAY